MFGILIQGGTVVDGTGAAGRRADIAIEDDRIAAMGDLAEAEAVTVVPADGLVVCPGFVDPHNHAFNEVRGGILRIPQADNLVRQGITTVLSGACGGSGYPVGEHLEQIEALRFQSNYATMVGYNVIKNIVTGKARRNPTPAEADEIAARLREGMAEGAFGVTATPHGHAQERTSTEELIAATRAVAPQGGFYHTHIRDEGEWGGHLDALAEVVRIAREGGARALSSHVKLWGAKAWGDAEKVDAIFAAAADEGLSVHADMYGYIGGYRGLGGLVGDVSNRLTSEDILRDPPLPEVTAVIDRQLGLIGGADHVILCPIDGDPVINGKTLLEVAEDCGKPPAVVAVELLRRGNVSCCWLAMRDEDVQHFLAAPYTMIGTDAHLRTLNDGHCHPRNYGNYPRILGTYVRDRGVLPLEAAIRKMTQRPAEKIGLRDRGVLRAGAHADVVVMDFAAVADNAMWAKPHRYPTGMAHVIVNGAFAVRDGQTTDALPGRVIRRGE